AESIDTVARNLLEVRLGKSTLQHEHLGQVDQILLELRCGRLDRVDRRLAHQPDMLDPDLVIRTGGEMRMSNFLLWQIAYTELCFCDVYWPDFERTHLLDAIRDYQQRKRRFGGVEGI
ncbi:MAG: undecaprenyl diphosphate synthase family protein, partial [Armatimonadetes bacterium]|nr:undecaprenyl diphosphate synthase family protein [Armatimonadota bacterium]